MGLIHLAMAGILATCLFGVDGTSPSECSPRNGVPAALARLKSGGEFRVAYFGGSITEANGWRVQVSGWLQKQYPASKIIDINAGMSGTNSDLGIYRVGYQVLRHKPNLVFIDFAVNDMALPEATISRNLELIIRRIREDDANTDICLLYAIRGSMMSDFMAGKMPRSIATMEKVAEHYRVASINPGYEILRQVQAGKMIFKGETIGATGLDKDGLIVFSKDDVHPLGVGHTMYAEMAERILVMAPGVAGDRSLPAPLDDKCLALMSTELLPIVAVLPKSGWRLLPPDTEAIKSFTRVPSWHQADGPGSSLTIRFQGTSLALLGIIGPDTGQLVVTVDKGQSKIVPLVNQWAFQRGISPLWLASGLPAGPHVITVTLDSKLPDKAASLGKVTDFIANPTKYANVAHATCPPFSSMAN